MSTSAHKLRSEPATPQTSPDDEATEEASAQDPSAPPGSSGPPIPEDPAADAEEDSEAGDKALPHPDELREGMADDPLLAQARLRLVKRLDDRRLRTRIVKFLMARHEVNEDRANVVTQDAFERAMCARKWPPENVPLYPWMRRYANFQLLKAGTRAKRDEAVVPDEHIDEHPVERSPEHPDAVDVARLAARAGAENDTNAATLEMWKIHAEGVPIPAIAVYAGIPEEAVRSRMRRFADAVRANWKELDRAATTTGAAVACAMLFFFLHAHVPAPRPAPPMGSDPGRALPTLPAPVSPQVVRAESFRQCNAAPKTSAVKTALEDWETCQKLLDRAAQVDPDGESRPDVKALRKRAANALGVLTNPKPVGPGPYPL